MTKKRVALFFLCGALCLLCSCAGADYKKAGSLLEQGDYDGARTIYQKLVDGGGYEDSEEMLKECDYLEADAACEAGDYEQAEELYKRLGEDAPRTAEGMQKVTYGRGKQCMESGNYVEAVELLSSTGGYDQSVALIEECAAALMEDPQPGDPVFFGIYEQDENEENGPEPVQWRVVARNGDAVLLLSEYILPQEMPFGASSAYWDGCELREWLNETFYSDAFSDREKALVQPMITSDITEDHVFLLTKEEAEGLLPEAEDRIAFDVYGAKVYNGWNTGYWWLRSQDTGDIAGRCYGIVDGEGGFWLMELLLQKEKESDFGVRPVICIRLSGETDEAAQNMSLFGYDSNVGFGQRDESISDPTLPGGTSHSNSGGGGTCPSCNGSGSIRFYYGSSDLEAWLTGHDAYTLQTCPMCNGSGRVS